MPLGDRDQGRRRHFGFGGKTTKILVEIFSSIKRYEHWLYVTWFEFVVRYRKTVVGPLWLLVGPALFISILGFLFAKVGSVPTSIFVPHLSIGLITWTLINGFVTGSSNVFQRNRPQILQGGVSLTDILMANLFATVLQFTHQVIIIVVVFLIYGLTLGLQALTSLVGLLLLILNGVWLSVVFGIVGARYRDLTEVTQAVMRIAFLATPIIWMPGDIGRSVVLSNFIIFNPFYHFLELIRAPLLNNAIDPLSWLVVLSTTVFGFALAQIFYGRYSRYVPLWV